MRKEDERDSKYVRIKGRKGIISNLLDMSPPIEEVPVVNKEKLKQLEELVQHAGKLHRGSGRFHPN